jgi:HlyD family secretion protein/adhesin transport system membrane fusion protein
VLKTLSEERSKIAGELAELKEQISKQKDRVDRLVVRAPRHGIVQELAQRAPGEVVKPGDVVASIVPLDRSIVAEVRVQPDDIGHIKEGDPAEIKLSTFDSAVFGVVKGSVSHLSATTFETAKGELFYKAIITMDQDHVGHKGAERPILPGMVVEADIITGAKSLVRYLLKPVYRSLDAGFTER